MALWLTLVDESQEPVAEPYRKFGGAVDEALHLLQRVVEVLVLGAVPG